MLSLQKQKNYVNILITKGFANMIEHKYLKLDEVVAMLNVSATGFYKYEERPESLLSQQLSGQCGGD